MRYFIACLIRSLIIVVCIGTCVWAFVRPESLPLPLDRYGHPAIVLVLIGATIVVTLVLVSWPVKNARARDGFYDYWL